MLQLFSAECRRCVESVIQLFRGKPRLLDTYELVLFDPGRIMLRGINASAAFCVVPGVPGVGDFSTSAVSCGTPGTRGINASAASRVAPVVMLHQCFSCSLWTASVVLSICILRTAGITRHQHLLHLFPVLRQIYWVSLRQRRQGYAASIHHWIPSEHRELRGINATVHFCAAPGVTVLNASAKSMREPYLVG
jgi:hypothetical protein